MTQPQKAGAIAEATGITWADWCRLLDRADAPSLPHDRIAVVAADHIAACAPGSAAAGNHEWWGQSVAIAYEQQIGRRVPGQTSRGDFQVAVTRTHAGDLDDALRVWLGLVAGRESFGGIQVDGGPRVSSTERWRYWRITLADGSRVSVDIGRKSTQKSTIGINHTRLETADQAEAWRGIWRGILAGLS